MVENYWKALDNAWKHWNKEKVYIQFFGFREWLYAEYSLRYNRTDIWFEREQGRLLFFLTWTNQ